MNKQQGFSVVAVIIIVLVVIAGGLYVYQKSSAPAPVTTPVTDTSITDNSNPTIVSIPADWQTYRNDEYGFEFKYPTNGVISAGGDIGLGGYYGVSVNLGGASDATDFTVFQIYDNENSRPATSYIDHIKGEQRVFNSSGISVTEIIPSEQTYAVDSVGNQRAWFAFSKGDYAYILYTLGPTVETTREILSTFRFTK